MDPGRVPRRVALIGVDGAVFDRIGAGMTPAVSAGIDQLVAKIVGLVGLANVSDRAGIFQTAYQDTAGAADEVILNRVEMAFRAYDPCLACATHAQPGAMALRLRIIQGEEVLRTIQRPVPGSPAPGPG